MHTLFLIVLMRVGACVRVYAWCLRACVILRACVMPGTVDATSLSMDGTVGGPSAAASLKCASPCVAGE